MDASSVIEIMLLAVVAIELMLIDTKVDRITQDQEDKKEGKK